MKVLWVDTGPLLDVLILELRESSRGTYERLQGLVGVLTSQARVLAFLDRVSEFGELRYSSGTLVELDRLARTRLPKGAAGRRADAGVLVRLQHRHSIAAAAPAKLPSIER